MRILTTLLIVALTGCSPWQVQEDPVSAGFNPVICVQFHPHPDTPQDYEDHTDSAQDLVLDPEWPPILCLPNKR